MTTGLPQGFSEGHAGDLACPHRDVTCCAQCQVNYPEIAIFGGQAFWVADPAERTESIALEKARIEKNFEKQISLFK